MVSDPNNGRDPGGRFGPGNKFSKGNSQARRMARYRAEILRSVSPEDIRAIVAKLVEMAKAGDVACAKEQGNGWAIRTPEGASRIHVGGYCVNSSEFGWRIPPRTPALDIAPPGPILGLAIDLTFGTMRFLTFDHRQAHQKRRRYAGRRQPAADK